MVTRRWGTPPGRAPSVAPRPRPEPPTGYVVAAEATPRVDGDLGDEAWAKAYPLRLRRTLDGSGRAAKPTAVRCLRDKSTLYIAVRCAEPLLGKLRAPSRPRDGDFWQDDSVEVFIGPAGGGYCHFGVTATGSVYDARGKDRSWDSGFRAAVGREKEAWTAEVAIPLADLAGEGPTPPRWRANFTRNRYAAGRWEEMAWSPTFLSDSHVPRRFGHLVFGEPPPGVHRDGEQEGAERRGSVAILPCEGAAGRVLFDLSDLPGDAEIYRADLRVFRTARLTGAHDAAGVAIEIIPLFSEPQAGRKPQLDGQPLALRVPWFDRFDATAAVRRWAAGEPNGGFVVKSCPLWDAEATCLEVAWEGKPERVPPPARDVRAFHREGQTFVTWREVDPLITAQKAAWGAIKKAFAEARGACRYRIYVHDRPITARNLHQARRLAEVGPLSARNVNARNKEYLIGQAMAQPDEMGELAGDYNGYMHTWTMDSPRMDRYPVEQFAIDEGDGPLPPGTGLYVHHPGSPGRRYYAVLSVRDGVESTGDIECAGPVEEEAGTGRPVRQGKGLWGPFFDYPGTRWVYVQWCAPPLAPRPNMAFNWSVLVPPDVEGRAPAELYFHPEGYSYAHPGKKLLRHSIQLAPHDYPFSGWYGFHSAWGTLKPFRGGGVAPHTQRRILAFLDWALGALPIDPERVLAVGADGAASLALLHPDRFATVFITGFDRHGVLDPEAAPRFAAAWGPKLPEIRDPAGRGSWGWASLDELVEPEARLPLFVCRGPSWGRVKGWGKGRGRFYDAMQAARQPLIAHWAWGGKLQKPDKYTGLWRGVHIRRTSPVPAFTNCSLDKEGEGGGNANARFSWRDVRETARSFHVTVLSHPCRFDLTPRRAAQFRPQPGEAVHWRAVPLAGRGEAEAQSGTAKADAHGLVTIRGLSIPRGRPGLEVTLERRSPR